jgi:flagella basal body P-ring formation protein FlgA
MTRAARLLLGLALVLAARLGSAPTALAEERLLPVPLAVIYPGDLIRDAMLGEKTFVGPAAADGSVVDSRRGLVGKVARRTLLPDRPIPAYAVATPNVVSVNSPVKIVFEERGLLIIAYGSALQAGAVGDLIRVRNQDSGLVVSGRVQADGSVRVSEG